LPPPSRQSSTSMRFVTLAFVGAASAFNVGPLAAPRVSPRTALTMFEESANDVKITGITRSREAGAGRTGSVVVTDDSGTFYNSRTIFTMLHDFGRYASIKALGSSVADQKKMLISRAGRYSGLLDVLTFHEGEPAAAFEGAASWLAINADAATIGAKVDAAAAAGVSRVFVLMTDMLAEESALEKQLQASGMAYTIMRVGTLVDAPAGSGYKLGAVDLPVCEDVAKDDVFRFVTEALTLEESHNRAFSLCPSEGTLTSLKEMRLCGYERRDEVAYILKGVVPDALAEAAQAEAPATAEEAELVLRSEAEVAAEREEELKKLLEKARQRGVETQQRMAFEEAERLANRKEQEKYYKAPDSDDKAPDTPPAPTGDAPETPETPPPAA